VRRTWTGRPTPPSPMETSLCIVCQDAPRDVRFQECGHSHACVLCSLKLISHASHQLACPTCKEPVVRIEHWDPLEAAPRPEFVKGGGGGVGIMQFIDEQAASDDVARCEAAKKARACSIPAAPARQSMEREHAVQTRELAGCWLNICTMAPVLPCSMYHVAAERSEDLLSFRALVCCAGVCIFPASGQYRRDNYHEELRYQRMDEGLSASAFIVKSRRRMITDVGGFVFKLW